MRKRATRSVIGFALLGVLIACLPIPSRAATATALQATTATTASASQYEVITDRNVMATMRDGTKLAADIHRPNAPGQFPALVIRTPYNKIPAAEPYVPFFPQRGYVVVVQDVRGRYASEGVFGQNKDDGWGKNQDGYDTIEWVAKQPWSNGKAAVTGISAPASSGALLMPTQPPHLTAGVLEVSGVADSYVYRFYNGGVFKYWILQWLLGSMAPDIVSREVKDPVVRDNVLAQLKAVQTDQAELRKAFLALPLNPTTIVGNLNLPGLQFWKDWLTHQTRDSYWDDMAVLTRTSRINVPTAHVSGWFDVGLQGTIDQFNAVQSNGGSGARGKQKLVVGPWVHATNLWVDKAGELTFPGGKMNGREGYLLRYFDTYLEGLPTGLQDEPPVLIYVMGDNIWRSENEWPLARTQYTNYYLRDGAGGSPIDSLNGNKLLSTEKPTGVESTDSYAYDPAKPVWTLGGRKLSPPQGPTDHRGAERQSLTFTTPPLEKDVQVTGQVKGVIYAMSSAPDTDWVVRLTDVYPDGRSMWVAEGILRASFRDSLEKPSLIEPDKVYKYEIDMWATSQVFKQGHSIRVTVTSSDFPHYARNLNTGKDNHTTTEIQVAYQTIFHDVKRPSHVVLPIIPR